MKVVTQIIIAFVSVLLILTLTNSFVIYHSNSAKDDIEFAINKSLSLNEVASQLQSESQNIDIQLSTVMNANDANIINNEIFYLHEKMDAFINSLSSSHLADVNYLENIADDLKEVIEQKISIKKLILDKENKIKTDRNEMENVSVSSAIIIKRTLTMSNEPDEFLIKDIESYLEKINASIAMTNKILFVDDEVEAKTIVNQMNNLKSLIEDDEEFLYEELPSIRNEKDYISSNDKLMRILFSENSIPQSKLNAIRYNDELEQLNVNYLEKKEELSRKLIEIRNDASKSNEVVKKDISITLDSIVKIQLVSLFLCCTVIVVSACILARKIKTPINYLLDVLQGLIKGNYSQSVTCQGWSLEFSLLIHQLNEVIVTNRELINKVKSNNLSIFSSSEDNARCVDNLRGLNNSQVLAVHSISAASEQLEQTSKETESYINNTRNHTRGISNSVDDAICLIDGSVDGNDLLSEMIKESSLTISEVEFRTKDIRNIVDVINDIASQTNLLALNAAIEAARAGSYGRGFSVVSDEVSNLAKQTTQSTNKIQKLIEALNMASSNAVESMSVCTEQMKKNSKDLQQTKAAISDISEHVSELVQQTDIVAQYAQEQFQSCGHIANSVSSVVLGFDKSVEYLDNVSGASHSLLSLSNGQKEELNKFLT